MTDKANACITKNSSQSKQANQNQSTKEFYMSSILLISGHPHLDNSIANRTIVSTLQDSLGDELTVRRLDTLYSHDDSSISAINVEAEQAALLEADIIIWQFPFYWYGLPALMKSWLDEVFLYGFSHGSANKLAGKKLLLSFTTGAPAAAYQHGKPMNHTVDGFLAPLEQTADLCQLQWQPPVYSNGMMTIPNISTEQDIAAVETEAQAHAQRLLQQVGSLLETA